MKTIKTIAAAVIITLTAVFLSSNVFAVSGNVKESKNHYSKLNPDDDGNPGDTTDSNPGGVIYPGTGH